MGTATGRWPSASLTWPLDAVAKIAGLPLYRLLADRFGDGNPERAVWVYAAGGYYHPGKDIGTLMAEIQSYLTAATPP